MKKMNPLDVVRLVYKSLVYYTDNFSESNFFSHFKFGKLYRGIKDNCGYTKYFMVKIWDTDFPKIYNCEEDFYFRLLEEVALLRHEMVISHPGMAKLYGYYYKGSRFAVVYEFKPFDSLFNLLPKESFTWLQRMKTALGLASLLRYLHLEKSAFYQPFLVHSLDAANVVLDEEYNPKLCDFGSISGGIFPDKRAYSCHHGCYGCLDISLFNTGDRSNKQDVFAFGVVLLFLISKRVYTDEDSESCAPFVFEWAFREYEEALQSKTEFSLVHKSLADEDDFCTDDGHKITMLALECVNGDENQRPTMKQVVKSLLKLELVKQNADFLGVDKVLNPCENGI
ncbi:hypothetical protein ABFS83_13G030100 [Erythranthe nasuta]